jgi:hypothetical protein
MNERIQKLYQQSYVTTTQQLRKGGWDNDREPFEYHTVTQTAFSPEKFAELIIKECAQIAEEVDGDWRARKCVLEHFGVENE